MASNPSAPAEEATPAKALPTFKQFLETCPPDVEMIVTGRASGPHQNRSGYSSGKFFNQFADDAQKDRDNPEFTSIETGFIQIIRFDEPRPRQGYLSHPRPRGNFLSRPSIYVVLPRSGVSTI
jgi:hypothetical protein